jgi:hypothetical protein
MAGLGPAIHTFERGVPHRGCPNTSGHDGAGRRVEARKNFASGPIGDPIARADTGGPVPSHLPLPLALVNRPIPLAWRGPATPLILVFPTCLSDASDSLALPSYLRRSEAVRHSPRLTRAGLYPVTRP